MTNIGDMIVSLVINRKPLPLFEPPDDPTFDASFHRLRQGVVQAAAAMGSWDAAVQAFREALAASAEEIARLNSDYAIGTVGADDWQTAHTMQRLGITMVSAVGRRRRLFVTPHGKHNRRPWI